MPADWTWIILDVLAVVVLGAIIAYGLVMSRRRRREAGPRAKRATEEATRQMYEDRDGERPPAP